MNAFQSYCLYLAIKMHFSSPSYDFFKFKGKVSAKPQTFEKRRDQYFFKKILDEYPTRERLVGFYVSNFLKKANFWVGDYKNKESRKNYQEWLGKVESLRYIFRKDLRKVKNESEKLGISFRKIFKVSSGETQSKFLEMVLDGEITLETYVMVDKVLGLSKYYEDKVIDPLYEEFAIKVKKYSPFIEIDRGEFSELFKEYI